MLGVVGVFSAGFLLFTIIECYDLATIVGFGKRMLLIEVSELEINIMDSRDRKTAIHLVTQPSMRFCLTPNSLMSWGFCLLV